LEANVFCVHGSKNTEVPAVVNNMRRHASLIARGLGLRQPRRSPNRETEMRPPIQAIFFDLGETLVTSQRRWLPGAKALLSSLAVQGFRLGIISNTAQLVDRAAILNLLPADFDISAFESALVIFSSEVGIEKPNREIFNKAVVAAALDAEKCLFCSETPIDTLVAQSVGMRSLRIITGSSDLSSLTSYLALYTANL
jgi:FMN phosphatase YigB (HAD superfamily)